MILSLLSQVKQKTWIRTLADTLTSTPSAAPPGSPRLMYCSHNATAMVGRVWSSQIAPGNAAIVGFCHEVKIKIFGSLFESTDSPQTFSNFKSNFPVTAQVQMPSERTPQLLKTTVLYCNPHSYELL